jgi:hypothetical protein
MTAPAIAYFILALVALQRLSELVIARRKHAPAARARRL